MGNSSIILGKEGEIQSKPEKARFIMRTKTQNLTKLKAGMVNKIKNNQK